MKLNDYEAACKNNVFMIIMDGSDSKWMCQADSEVIMQQWIGAIIRAKEISSGIMFMPPHFKNNIHLLTLGYLVGADQDGFGYTNRKSSSR